MSRKFVLLLCLLFTLAVSVPVVLMTSSDMCVVGFEHESIAGLLEPSSGSQLSTDPFDNFQIWLDALVEPKGDRQILLREGRRLALARKAALLELIQCNPDKALEKILSISEYERIPASFKGLVEEPVSTFGDVELRWITKLGPDGSSTCLDERWLHLKDGSYRLYGQERRMRQKTLVAVPVCAYLLEHIALVPDSPVLELSGDSILAAERMFAPSAESNVDRLTGVEANSSTAALIAGTVYRLSTRMTSDEISGLIMRAEDEAAMSRSALFQSPLSWLQGSSSGRLPSVLESSAYFNSDTVRVLYIRIDFSDIPGSPIDRDVLESDVEAVSARIREMSFGKASLVYAVTSAVYRAPQSGESYAQNAAGYDLLYQDIQNVYSNAPEAGDYSDYDVVSIYFASLADIAGSIFGNGGVAGGARQWITGLPASRPTERQRVICHEFGHNFGVGHSNYWHPEREIGNFPVGYNDARQNSLEYGDIFDIMGVGPFEHGDFNPQFKHTLGWIPDDRIVEVKQSGLFRVYSFDHVSALGRPVLALKISVNSQVSYWLGQRSRYPGNPNLSSGAYVVAEGLNEWGTNLIDLTPESASSESEDRQDAGLPVGASYTQPEDGFTIQTIGTGSEVDGQQWIDVRVDFTPRIGFANAFIEVDEARGMARIPVIRGFNSAGRVAVAYTTQEGTATSGIDYHPVAGRLTWDDGESDLKEIVVPIRPDDNFEGIENLSVCLSDAEGAVIDTSNDIATVSILDPGQRYSSFQPDFFHLAVDAIVFQSTGSAIIAGTINSDYGDFKGVGNIARLNLVGKVDHSFNMGGSGFDAAATRMVVLPDDSLVVSGPFTRYNGIRVPPVVRLGRDGELDLSFVENLGSGFDRLVFSIEATKEGQILVGGDFTEVNGVPCRGLVRLNDNGTIDHTFSAPFDPGPAITDIVALRDGKLLVTGIFAIGSTGTGFRSSIARLNKDGSLDNTFNQDAGLHVAGNIHALSWGKAVGALPNGNCVVGGGFSAYDENATDFLALLGPDGEFLEPSPTDFNNWIEFLFVEPTGGILAMGNYSDPWPALVRINADWEVDPHFTASGAAPRFIASMAYDNEGGLWIGGNFFEYNGTWSRPVVRVASGITPYEFWAGTKFDEAHFATGKALAEADPDGDGLANFAEMAFGTDPLQFEESLLALSKDTWTVDFLDQEDGLQLILEITVKDPVDGLWYSCQVSEDLVNWFPEQPDPSNTGPFIVERRPQSLIFNGGWPLNSDSPKFFRMILSHPH